MIVRPHRAQTILILGVLGFMFGPFAMAAVFLAKRDLKSMAAGSMDRSGEGLTRVGRWLGCVAGIIWAIQWTILLIVGLVIYLNWGAISRNF